MRPTWVKIDDFCDIRGRDSFPAFPDALAGPDGQIDSWLKKTRIIPVMAHEYRCRPGWSVGPRRMQYSVWWIFPESGGLVTLPDEKRRIPFKPGDLILMPEGVKHQVAISAPRPTQEYAGHFYANVYGSLNLLSLMGFPVVIPASGAAVPREAAAAMIREYELKKAGWQTAMEGELVRMLLYVMRHHGRRFDVFPRAHLHKDLPRLFPVFELIESRLHDPDLSVGELAGHICVSEVYLRRLFRSMAGMSVISFILQQRVKRACVLLQQSHGIKVIAGRCGFASTIYFHRIFKRFMHETPAQFARRRS